MSSKADAVNAITNLIYGYAEALDRGDLAAVAAYFEHCLVHVNGLPNKAQGGAEVLEFFRAGRQGGAPLEKLTASVRQWLADRDLLKSVRVTVVAR